MLCQHNLILKTKKFNSPKSIQDYKSLLKIEWNNNVFYSYEYLVYHENQNQKLRYFLLEQDGKPIILMPFLIRLIPIDLSDNTKYYDIITPYGYGGPLFNRQYENYLDAFWKKVDKWHKDNNIVTEFVRFSLTDNYKKYSGDLKHTLLNIKGKILSDQNEQWKKFSPKVRNNYRTAIKSELTFVNVCGGNINKHDIYDFHAIYIDTMKRNNADKSYFFKLEYFEKLIFENKDNFEIVFVEKDGNRISTELLIYWKDTMFAFLGGTKKEYFQYRPNDFLRVEVIKLAYKKNITYYILGGGRTDGDGLFKSKKALFPKDNDSIFYTGRKILNEAIYMELTNKHHNLGCKSNSSFFPEYREPV